MHESNDGSIVFLLNSADTLQTKTRDLVAGMLLVSGRTRFLLFSMLVGETAATCVDVG